MNPNYIELQDNHLIGEIPANKEQIVFDPYKLPASIEDARKHLKATKIGLITGNIHDEFDPQTKLPTQVEPISLCCDTEDLKFLSPGYPLYFQFLKFSIYIGMTITICCGIFAFITNLSGDSCISSEEVPLDADYTYLVTTCVKNFMTELSLANKMHDDINLEKQEIYNLFTVVILLLSIQYMRKFQKEYAIVCDERDITVADYTIRVNNIPQFPHDNQNIEELVKQFFVENGVPGRRCNVRKVSICYQLDEKLQYQEEIENLLEKKKILEFKKSKGKNVAEQDLLDIDKRTRELKTKIAVINKQFKEKIGINDKFSGEAYVTFETQKETQEVLEHWRSISQKYFHFLRIPCLPDIAADDSPYRFKGNILRVEPAPEPKDIIWENAGYSQANKFIRRISTYLLIALMIFIFSVIIYIINSVIVDTLTDISSDGGSADDDGTIDDSSHDNSDPSEHDSRLLNHDEDNIITPKVQRTITIVTSVTAFIIVLINQFLKFMIEKFAEYEKYGTKTDYWIAYCRRLTYSQFLNTSIVYLLVAAGAHNYWGPGGMISVVFQIMVLNAIIPWIADLIDFSYLVSQFRRNKIQKSDPNEILMTQKNLNKLYKYPKFDFATKYASYLKTLWSGAVFAPLLPSAMVLAIVGICVSYWIDKYVILRKRSRGVYHGPELAFHNIELLDYTMVFFSAGNAFFMSEVTGFNSWQLSLCFIGAIIGLLNVVLPMSHINAMLFPIKPQDVTDETYSEMESKFQDDYDKRNPATEEIVMRRNSQDRRR